jgi:hypothetical protein
MEPPPIGPPPSITEVPAGGAGRPPGAARIGSLLEAVGLIIFAALLIGAATILIRQRRRR